MNHNWIVAGKLKKIFQSTWRIIAENVSYSEAEHIKICNKRFYKEIVIWDKCHGQPAVRDGCLNSRFEFLFILAIIVPY